MECKTDGDKRTEWLNKDSKQKRLHYEKGLILLNSLKANTKNFKENSNVITKYF